MAKINIQAAEAIAELKQLAVGLNDVREEISKLNTISATTFTKLETGLNSLGTANIRLGNLVKTLSKNLRANTTQVKANVLANKANTAALNTLTPAMEKATKSTVKNTKATKANTKSGKQMLNNLSQLAGALGFAGVIASIGKTILSVINLTIKFQSLGYAIDYTSKQVGEAGRSSQFLIELNNKFGADLVSTTERWLKFRTAARQSGITLLETKKIFESVTKASAVLGLRTDELRGVYLALEQMLSKGKITTEELRRQLGERLPGAMGIMAASMGKTIPELDKMMKKGEVLSAEVLPGFAKALEEAYGIEALDSVENLATAVGKMTGAWEQLVKTISEGSGAVSGTLGFFMSWATKYLGLLNSIAETEKQRMDRISPAFNDEIVKGLNDAVEATAGWKSQFSRTRESITTDIRAIAAGMKSMTDVTPASKLREENNATFLAMETELNKLSLELKKFDEAKKEALRVQAVVDLPAAEKNFKELEEKFIGDGKNWGEIFGDAITGATSLGGIGVFRVLGEVFDTYEEAQKKLIDSLDEDERKLYLAKELLAVLREQAEVGDPAAPLDTPTGTTRVGGKVKLAEEFNPTNKFYIADLKEQIKYVESLREKEFTSLEERKKNLNILIDLQKELSSEELIAANQKLTEDAEKKKLKFKEKEGQFSDFPEKLLQQQKETAKATLAIDAELKEDLELALLDHIARIVEINEMKEDEDVAVNVRDIEDRITLLKAEGDVSIKAAQDKADATAAGSEAEAEALHELSILKAELYNEEIDLQILLLKAKMLHEDLTPEQIEGIEKMITALGAAKINIDAMNKSVSDGEDAWKAWLGEGVATMEAIGELAQALSDAKISQIEAEIAKEEEKYARLLELAQNDEAETKILERNRALRLKQLEEKKRKEQIKQAKFEKKQAIVKATINLALAIGSALSTVPPASYVFAALNAVLAGIELAAVIATPIPSFAKGGIMPHDGVAQINDGGNQEYVERDGKVLTSKQTNALVDLRKGDIIHKDYESLNKNTMILSTLANGKEITEDNFNKLYAGIERSIENGFGRAKINNKVTVLNKVDAYRLKMQNWN
jgi:tape measure domain-containing protein